MKFKTKLIFLVAGVVIIPIVVTALVGFFSYTSSIRNHTVLRGHYFRTGKWIKHDLPREWKKSYPDFPEIEPPPGLDVAVFDLNNRVVLSSIQGFDPGSQEDPEKAIKSMVKDPHNYPVLLQPLIFDERVYGSILIRLPMRHEGLPKVFYGFLAFIIFSAAVVTIMANSLKRSIVNLERATRKIAEGDLDFELKIKGKDEIASLTGSFDTMRMELKESLAKRSRFLMGVSHDLKTPLTSIKGYLEAISDGLADDPDILKKYIDIVTDKSKVLEERITELIDFVKMETGEWKLKHEVINLPDFFSQIAVNYREDASVFKRKFKSSIEIPRNITAVGDRNLLLRAFENLIGNAIRYTNENDTILMKVYEDDGDIHITIEDTGPGIPEEEINHIFDPFYRGTGSRREHGSGLGLSIVKSVVAAHGWKIDAFSTPGKGTIFHIRIKLR